MSIAIDRYLVIIHPFKPRMSNHICWLIIGVIWLSGGLLTLPYANFMVLIEHSSLPPLSLPSSELTAAATLADVAPHDKTSSSSDLDSPEPSFREYCDEAWPYEESRRAYSIVTTVLQFFVPLVIIGYCYIKVCGELKKRAKLKPGAKSARKEKLERERSRRTNRMLIAMVCIFCICWSPLNAHNLLVDFYQPASNWPYIR
jgi:neuropeptide Y receptor